MILPPLTSDGGFVGEKGHRLNITLMALPPRALTSKASSTSRWEKPYLCVIKGFTSIFPLVRNSRHRGQVFLYRKTPTTSTSLVPRRLVGEEAELGQENAAGGGRGGRRLPRRCRSERERHLVVAHPDQADLPAGAGSAEGSCHRLGEPRAVEDDVHFTSHGALYASYFFLHVL